MKLLIKGNDRGIRVTGKGDTKKMVACLMMGIHELLVEIVEDEQGFENAKDIFTTCIKDMNYDGTVRDSEITRDLCDEH